MGPKRKGGGKKKGGGNKSQPKKSTTPAAEEDDDWAILNAAAAQNEQAEAAKEEEKPAATAEPEPTKDETPPPEDAAAAAAAAFLASQGLNEPTNEGEKKTTKKKKKKKKPTEKTEKPEKPEAPAQSAKGRLVAERLRQKQLEEERIRAAEEAERKRIEEEEAREEAERKRIQEEKERKKQRKKERIEKMKKEGTYMTAAQKAKARLAEQRLEAMRAAGMLPPAAQKATTGNQKNMYGKKNKGKHFHQQQHQQQQQEQEEEEKEEDKNEEESPTKKDDKDDDDVAENWDDESQTSEKQDDKKPTDGAPANEEDEDDDVPDDWDASSVESGSSDKFADLERKLQQVNVDGLQPDSDADEEDLAEAEKRREKERLKQLGIERERREREEAEKLAAMMREEAERTKKEQMAAQLKAEAKRKRVEQEKANLAARTRDDLRCPIVVIMGHVDTGKTKLLDKIRKTNVQEGEAGGITQQIGATFFEKKTLEYQTERLNKTEKVDLTIPGMLVIDTPGHESFTNLRSRGSSLCDLAILVVDLMHGLEQQTIESLNMLRAKGTPFVVALNKVDRCYAWVTCPDAPIREALEKQDENTRGEFRSRAADAKLQLQEQGVNSNIYWEMGEDDWETTDFIPLVPTSAISGEGVQDILLLLCQMAQRKLWKQIMWCANLQCTVLEVKAIDGLGMTVDVLVVNGHLKEGDRAAFCTLDGPIVAEIRGLLTPPPSREMRIKSDYIHHKTVKGALGVKIIGNGLEKVMAGTPVMVVGPDDDEEDIKSEVMSDLQSLQDKLSTDKKGVMVQASTLGALEALLQFLREETKPPIPVSAIGIGTVHKRDVTKISIMNEKGCPEFATILAFDVPIEREAREYATEMSVRIFTADIIYHLFDQFTRFMEELTERRREEAAAVAVFPCILKILPQHIFNQKDPIIVGVEIVEGIAKVGTPLCVPALGGLHVGKITSIESNGREQETARKGASVAIKIVNENNPTITYGRQFDSTNSLYSTLSRASIDALKANFKDKLENEDWRLVVKLKKVFNII